MRAGVCPGLQGENIGAPGVTSTIMVSKWMDRYGGEGGEEGERERCQA